jgi:anti-sigma regulatory factor (Ser/Thr protein kinase)
MWRTSERFACVPAAPSHARRFCAQSLGSALGDNGATSDVVADVEIIVSELVTNAINAGCTKTEVQLTAHEDVVRIDVHDDGFGTPVQQHPSIADEHGRGLLIVAALARDWGVVPCQHGKIVWAEIGLASAGV